MSHLNNYFSRSLEHVSRGNSNLLTDSITLGECTAEINTYSTDMRNIFFPALSHLSVGFETQPDLTIYYVCDECLERPFKAPQWGDIEFNAQGFASALDQEEIGVFFQPWLRQIFLYSYKQRIGIYWVKSVLEIPWWEATFSFRILFHMWSRDNSMQLIHSGAITSDEGQTFLFPGASGSGKSTTTCLLYEAGYHYLGDDYVMVNAEEGTVFKLYRTSKMEWVNLEERFPHLLAKTMNLEYKPEGKGVFYLDGFILKMKMYKIDAILMPSIKGEGAGIIPSSTSAALMAIVPTTLHHLPHHRAASYQKISKLVSKHPNFTWSLPVKMPDVINQFKDFHNDTFT